MTIAYRRVAVYPSPVALQRCSPGSVGWLGQEIPSPSRGRSGSESAGEERVGASGNTDLRRLEVDFLNSGGQAGPSVGVEAQSVPSVTTWTRTGPRSPPTEKSKAFQTGPMGSVEAVQKFRDSEVANPLDAWSSGLSTIS